MNPTTCQTIVILNSIYMYIVVSSNLELISVEVGKYVVPRRQKAQAVITIVDKVSDLVKPIDSSYNFNPVLRYGPTQEKRHNSKRRTN